MLFRRAAARRFGASCPRFRSLFYVDGENTRAATHVDSCDGVLSDAGSTPAASTISSLRSLMLSVAWSGRSASASGLALPARLAPPPPSSPFYRDELAISVDPVAT